MSLEQALIENTETMKRLIVVMSTAAEAGALVAPTAAPAAAEKRTRKGSTPAAQTTVAVAAGAASEQPAAQGAVLINHGGETIAGVVEGDPVGTLYYVIEKHSTAAAVRPNEVIPDIEGMLQVGPAEYLAAKERFAGKLKTPEVAAPAAAPTPAPAASPAPATPAASTASSPTPDASPASGVTKQQITEALVKLHGLKGNSAVAPILAKFEVARVPELPVTDEVFKVVSDALASAEMGL